MNKILLIFFVFITLTGVAQKKKKKAIKYFNLGVIAYNKKDFKAADSLFTLSAKIEPHTDTYFNLAATKNKLDDFCGFCENMYKASIYGSGDAEELYSKNCTTRDSVFYDKVNSQGYNYYCIITYHKCSNKKNYQFYKLNTENQEIIPFNIILTDRLKYNESDFESSSFDILSVPIENISFFAPEMPCFPGGNYALDEFIYTSLKNSCKNFKYCNGTVSVSFDIEKDGTLTNIQLVKSQGKECDDESIRIVKSMPKWIPAKKDGKAVKSKYMVKIAFDLI